MRASNIKIETETKKYSLIIGSNILEKLPNILSNQKILFKKCLIVIDKNVPKKFKSLLINKLSKKKIFIYNFYAYEKKQKLQKCRENT